MAFGSDPLVETGRSLLDDQLAEVEAVTEVTLEAVQSEEVLTSLDGASIARAEEALDNAMLVFGSKDTETVPTSFGRIREFDTGNGA